jgi:hypothetical protein
MIIVYTIVVEDDEGERGTIYLDLLRAYRGNRITGWHSRHFIH